MKLDRKACRTALFGIALWTAGCSSGLPTGPSPEGPAAHAGTHGAVAGAGAGSESGPTQEPAGLPPAAGSSSPGPGSAGNAGTLPTDSVRSGMTDVGGPCPMGPGDCRVGLVCLETMVNGQTVKLCASPCESDDDSECTPDDDE